MKLSRAFPVLALLSGCVPPGNSTQGDAGATTNNNTAIQAPSFRPSQNIMTTVFEDNFERTSHPMPTLMPSASAAPSTSASASASASALASASATPSGSSIIPGMNPQSPPPDDLGPNWHQAQTNAWHIENGRLCGQMEHNHGVWLNRVLPINARIEFDAIADTADGDLKAESWGDGQSHATSVTYNNATSYITVLGGWKNKFHVMARVNEHAPDRREIKVDKDSDDPKDHPVSVGQIYHFKIERVDGKTVRWAVNGLDMFSWDDPSPLAGVGHDHFGFNGWEVKTCFDNVKVTPLP